MKKYNDLIVAIMLCFSLLLSSVDYVEARGGGGHGGGHSGKSSSSSKSSKSGKKGKKVKKVKKSGKAYSSTAGKGHRLSSAGGYKHATYQSKTIDGSVKRDSHGRIARSETAKSDFLKAHGYSKIPKGYNIDHIIPLYAGGKDTPSNMQLISISAHHAKTKADFEKYGR